MSIDSLFKLTDFLRDVLVFLIVFLCIGVALSAHALKKLLLKKLNATEWQNYKFPFKLFAAFLAFNYILLLPVVLKSFSLLSCEIENFVGLYPLGIDNHIYWLIFGSPLLLTAIFQRYDIKFLLEKNVFKNYALTIFINLVTSIVISLLILMSVAGSLFSSSWPCEGGG